MSAMSDFQLEEWQSGLDGVLDRTNLRDVEDHVKGTDEIKLSHRLQKVR